MPTKEEIYDDQIAPLMSKIIEICKANKIANLCTFALDDEDGEQLACTTAMLTEEFDPPEEYKQAFDIIKPPERSPMMMTVTKADGSKEIIAVL